MRYIVCLFVYVPWEIEMGNVYMYAGVCVCASVYVYNRSLKYILLHVLLPLTNTFRLFLI